VTRKNPFRARASQTEMPGSPLWSAPDGAKATSDDSHAYRAWLGSRGQLWKMAGGIRMNEESENNPVNDWIT